MEKMESWVNIFLNQICQIETGKWDANHANKNGKYRFYTCAFSFSYCNTYRFEGKSLILPGNGANVGEVFYYNGKFDAYQRTYIIHSILVNEKYLYYHLLGNWRRKNIDKQYGSATNYIRIGNFNEYTVPIPPLPEQRAIVNKIETLFSELDNGIASLKKAQQQLKLYRQSVLQQAFEGKLTEQWRKEQKNLPTATALLEQIETERQQNYNQRLSDWKSQVKKWEDNGKQGRKPTKTRKLKELPPLTEKELEVLPVLPSGWKWVKLGKLTSKVSDGPFGSNLKTADYVDSGVRVIRLENIKNLRFEDSKKSFVTPLKYETIKKHTVYPNDIIFSTFISNETRVTRVPNHIPFAINKADCVCIRTENSVEIKFIEFFLSTKDTCKRLSNQVHGATRPRVNTTQIKSLAVPVCSKAEQTQIISEIESRLSVADKLIQDITDNLSKSKALSQSILKKAFEGRLLTDSELAACRAEADWESAVVLLERIKAEK